MELNHVKILLLAFAVSFATTATYAASPLDAVRPFLKMHCQECHGPETQENDKRFDTLGDDLMMVETLEIWQEIVDVLNRDEMPPKELEQPDSKKVAEVIRLLTVELQEAYARHRSTSSQTVARRLNRFELRNTVRDLLRLNDPELRIGNVARLVDNNGNGSVENTSTDPFRSFPPDEEDHGFDNIGNRLVMSDFFLKLMFDAAEESLALATEIGPKPEIETRRFAGHIQKGVRGDLEKLARERHSDFDTWFRRDTIVPDPVRGGVGVSARYRLTVEVSAHNQQHPWGELITADQSKSFQLSLRLHKRGSRTDFIPLKVFQVPGDGKKRTYSAENWIDANWIPELIWENAPTDREARSDMLVQKFLPSKFRKAPDRRDIKDKKQYDEARAKWQKNMTTVAFDYYKGPSLRVYSIVLEPLINEWPPASHTALYGSSSFDDDRVESLLHSFAERAYRRPVSPDEIAPFVELVKQQLNPDPDPVPTVIKDLTFKSYKGKWAKLPEFNELTPERDGNVEGGLVDLKLSGHRDYFALLFEGKLTAGKTAEYEIQMASDDGARIFVDGQKILEHDGLHGPSPRKHKLKLKKGDHDIRIEYLAYGLPNSFRASWTGPGFRDAPLAAANAAKNKPIDVDAHTAQGIKAMQIGYAAILCSPDFLYIRENGGPLDQYEIASRLSYFLWSSMPDEKLFELAKAGRLTDKNVLEQQVDRMLNDPGAAAFTRHFTERWLRLDKLRESPPELTGPFRIYWDRRMEPQAVAQTDAYFADVIKSNRSIGRLIDSDYTFMNENIAQVFYGRNDVKGDSLRKVATNDPRRGGMFTQPSVMTATANGVDTSPVVRGVWVLENILGTPPLPPPPDVEPLSPDLRHAKTIREQLEVHRKQQACSGCHRKIDPLGFAFENFDPIGRWRERYPKVNGTIDVSTVMANGRELKDIVEFKKMLLDREDQVARCLVEKMLAYSTGRLLESTDRGEVNEVVNALASKGNRLRDLIKLVVQSRLFLTK